MRVLLGLVLLGVLVLNAGCGKPEPVRLGFIGGLSDRNADLGSAGLAAVQMAVDQVNRAGGIQGRPVELLVRDDAQNREVAARAAQELVQARADAVIGPFTSGMAEVVVPVLAQADIFEVSPTVTSMQFFGKDDNLFRINRSTRDNARDYAKVLLARGLTHVAVAYDLRNSNFTESWLAEFRSAMAADGARLAAEVSYASSAGTDFPAVLKNMLVASPDALFFIASAVDVAMLSQQARLQAPRLPIGASEWAASEQLASLGGKMVEGLLIIQNFDREDKSPRFLEFAEAYQQHYQKFPGYSAVMAYDAAQVALAALKNRRKGETVKSAALRSGPYPGLQQEIVFDANGDTQRHVVFTEIHNGQFMKVRP